MMSTQPDVGDAEAGAASTQALGQSLVPASTNRGRRRGWGWLFVVIGLPVFLVGAWHLPSLIRFTAGLARAGREIPLAVPVDVSKRGVTDTTLDSFFTAACKQPFELQPVSPGDMTKLAQMTDLYVQLTLTSPKGEVDRLEGGIAWWMANAFSDAVFEWRWRAREHGPHQVRFEVLTPTASAVPVRLVSRYELCGLEWMAAVYGWVVVGGGVVIGGLMLWVGWRWTQA